MKCLLNAEIKEKKKPFIMPVILLKNIPIPHLHIHNITHLLRRFWLVTLYLFFTSWRRSAKPKMIKAVWDWLSYWYLRFILGIGIYMLEPRERWALNSLLVSVFAMAVYTSYIFLPGHFIMLVSFIKYLLGFNGDSDTLNTPTVFSPTPEMPSVSSWIQWRK